MKSLLRTLGAVGVVASLPFLSSCGEDSSGPEVRRGTSQQGESQPNYESNSRNVAPKPIKIEGVIPLPQDEPFVLVDLDQKREPISTEEGHNALNNRELKAQLFEKGYDVFVEKTSTFEGTRIYSLNPSIGHHFDALLFLNKRRAFGEENGEIYRGIVTSDQGNTYQIINKRKMNREGVIRGEITQLEFKKIER